MTRTLRTTAASRVIRWVVLGTVALGLAGAARGAPAEETELSAAQVWLISTRCAPACGAGRLDDPRIGYWALGANRQWIATDRTGFLARDRADTPTIFYLHGNQIDSQEAVRQGWQICGHLKQQADGRAFRLVIWSWPSQRVDRRVLQDVRIKAARSDVQAYYLAGLLHETAAEVPVSLLGYSFGSRAIAGALEMLAGGRVAGLSLPSRAETPRPQMRAMLLAAAMDNRWLLPGGRNGNALGQVQHMLVARNLADPVLKRYHWLYPGCHAQALGWAGPACPAWLGRQQEKLEVLDLTCWVGRNHVFDLYANVEPIASRLGWYCFLDEPGSQAAASR